MIIPTSLKGGPPPGGGPLPPRGFFGVSLISTARYFEAGVPRTAPGTGGGTAGSVAFLRVFRSSEINCASLPGGPSMPGSHSVRQFQILAGHPAQMEVRRTPE